MAISMTRKTIGVVMDPIGAIKPHKDTTLALLLAAKKAGWDLLYFEQQNLGLDQGKAIGKARKLDVFDDNRVWYQFNSEPFTAALGDLDAVMMRKDPPFDGDFLNATYILDAAEKQGALVVNQPSSIRDCNEKLFATEFPQCGPPLVVSSDIEVFRAFLETHKDIILKPLDGMGGKSIFRVTEKDHNLSVIVETLTELGSRMVMAQRYIPEIVDGDKRILLIDGEPVPYSLARIPAQGESRGNLAAGGSGIAKPLSDRDRWICEQVGPELKRRGLLFVGIDVIGDYLTEINVTSPTCVRELDKQCNLDIGSQLIRHLESKL